MAIRFHTEDVGFVWKSKRKLFGWIRSAAKNEGKDVGEINIILCSDEFLLKMNQQYLDHDYYTDIITFDYTEGVVISGDLYISLDRVNENANANEIPTTYELYRVVIHGIMHLCGYNDKKESDSVLMRKKEDFYLSNYINI